MNRLTSWDDAPSIIFDPDTYKGAPPSECRLIFSPLGLLANQIALFAPHLKNKPNLHIVIAGADGREMANKGLLYQFLPYFIPTSSQWRIDLVGLESDSNGNIWGKLDKRQCPEQKPVIKLHKKTLQTFLSKSKTAPDIIIFNHPGFESYGESWFEDDQLNEWTLNNPKTLMLGASYSDDEALLDKFIAKQYGFAITDITDNPLTLTSFKAPEGEVSVPKMMRWAGQMWKMSAIDQSTLSDDEFDDTENGKKIAKVRLLWHDSITQLFTPADNFADYMAEMESFLDRVVISHENSQCIMLVPDVYLDLSNGNVIDTESDEVLFETEMNLACVKEYLGSDFELNPMTAGLISGLFIILYEEAYASLYEMTLNANEEESDSELLFPGGEERVKQIMAGMGMPSAREMSPSEITLSEDAKKMRPDELLKKYTDREICDYRNTSEQNLLVESILNENWDLFVTLLPNTMLHLEESDSDGFHGWNALAEINNPDYLDKVIEVRGNGNINALDSFGRSGLMCASLRGCNKTQSAFMRHGAKAIMGGEETDISELMRH